MFLSLKAKFKKQTFCPQTPCIQFNWRPICKQEQTTTSESMDALSDIFDFLMENAPVAAAVGGVAASTALVANPSLPMTGTNGVPPGIYTY